MSSQPIYFLRSPPQIVTQYMTHLSLKKHPQEEKLTNRGKDLTRRHFSDYQNGRRMISELPNFKLKGAKDRSPRKDRIADLKLAHRDGTQSQMYQKIEKFFTRTVQQIEKIQKDRYESHVPKRQSQRVESPTTTESKSNINQVSRSLEVPNFMQRDLGMTRQASFYLSRKRNHRLKTEFINRPNMRDLIKQRKKEDRENLLGIIEGLTVEKKELIMGKTQKDLINKNKLLSYPKKTKSFFRALDSRIQPWSFFTNDGQHDN